MSYRLSQKQRQSIPSKTTYGVHNRHRTYHCEEVPHSRFNRFSPIAKSDGSIKSGACVVSVQAGKDTSPLPIDCYQQICGKLPSRTVSEEKYFLRGITPSNQQILCQLDTIGLTAKLWTLSNFWYLT